jgi:hypothetical protein
MFLYNELSSYNMPRVPTGGNGANCQECQQGATAHDEWPPSPRRRHAITSRADPGALTLSPKKSAAAGLSNLSQMPWTGVVLWMRDLDIDEEVIRVVQKDRVPGSQVAVMTLTELMEDMGLSKLQVHACVCVGTFVCA